MKKCTMRYTSKPKIFSYTSNKSRLSTIVDGKTMKQIYHDLDNPPQATPDLMRLLQEIEHEKHA